MKILVVEDDLLIAQSLQILLSNYNYAVDVVHDGLAGLEMAEAFEYDLLLLDILLPQLDGISLCQQLRTNGLKTPILLLTGQDGAHQKAIALNAGADDYMVKPFDTVELIARVQALLRRGGPQTEPILTWDKLSLDPSNCRITYGDHLVTLTPKESAILEFLLRNKLRVLSLGVILDQVWNSVETPSNNVVRAHIKEIRRKLKRVGAPKDLIKTIYGIGYQLNSLYSDGLTPSTDEASTQPQIAELQSIKEELKATKTALQTAHQELEITHQKIEQDQQQLQAVQHQLKQYIAASQSKRCEGNVVPPKGFHQWHTLFMQSLEAIIIADNNGLLLDANPTACDLFGVSKGEIIQRHIMDFTEPDLDMEQWGKTGINQSLKSGKLRLFRPDGTTKETEYSAIAHFIPGQHLVFFRDIRDLKHSETQIQHTLEREHLLETITESIGLPLDLDKILQSVVDQIRHYLHTDRVIVFRCQGQGQGIVEAESVSSDTQVFYQGPVRTISDLLTAESAPCNPNLTGRDQIRANLVIPILLEEQMWGFLIAHHCSESRSWDAEEIQLLQQVAAKLSIVIPQADLDHTQQNELLEQHQIKTALQASEERFRLLSTFAPIGIYLTDINGQCIYTNPHWQEIAGLTLEESLGEGWGRGIHPEDQERVFDAWNRLVKQESAFELDFRFLTPQGDVHWVVGRTLAMHSSTGELIGYVGVNENITERKLVLEKLQQSEAAIQESEERLVLALDAAFMAAWDWDILTNRVIWSGHPHELLGVTKELDSSFEGFMNTVYSEDHRLILEAIESARDKHVPYQAEFRIVWPDGSLHYMSGKGSFFYNPDGKAIRMIGILMDISDRKQAEVDLRRQAQIFASMTDGVILTDLENIIMDWNPAAEEIFGYTKAEVLGQTTERLHRSKDYILLTQQMRESISLQGHWSGEIEFMHKNGSPGISETVVVPLLDEQGQWVASIGLHHDITLRKQTEQQVHEQAALLDIATDAILVRDLNYRILFWNKGAEDLYGMTAAEALGVNANELLYPKGSRHGIEDIQSILLEKGEWQGELQQVTKTGQKILVASRWTLVRDPIGHPKSILTVNTDISEKKQLEVQSLRAQRLESVGTFASGIAHDLNNVLTPMLAISQLLRLTQKNQDASMQEQLAILETSAKQGANMVKQILTFARGSDGEKIYVDLIGLLKEVVKINQRSFPQSIEIRQDFPKREDIIDNLSRVWADPTHLHQVFMNLTINARDAMPKGGILTVSAQSTRVDPAFAQKHLDAKVGNYWRVTIADTGTGISPEVRDHIFDPFFTTKATGKGTGLGLSTVLGIVKNIGGFLQMTSEMGQGTQITVYLPAFAGTPSESHQIKKPLGGNGELVLIVDDEIAVQRTTQTLLEEYHYQTMVAKDGVEALELYTQNQAEIRLVVLDVMMPNMDGIELTQKLKSLNSNLKIIGMSGLSVKRSHVLEAGADVFITKPYLLDTLLNQISELLQTQENKGSLGISVKSHDI